MSIQITVRDVPRDVRDELAARAARQGKSMQEFLRAELERIASRPSLHAWIHGVQERKAAASNHVPSDAILDAINGDRR